MYFERNKLGFYMFLHILLPSIIIVGCAHANRTVVKETALKGVCNSTFISFCQLAAIRASHHGYCFPVIFFNIYFSESL